MTSLEDLKSGLKVTGTLPDQSVAIVDVKWHGSTAVELFYKRADGQPGTQLLFRDDESKLQVAKSRRAWSFNADGKLFRLVAEAYRIHLAHLFDPVLAVHTSLIELLPHQITGVYGDRLPRQPPRFLSPDDWLTHLMEIGMEADRLIEVEHLISVFDSGAMISTS